MNVEHRTFNILVFGTNRAISPKCQELTNELPVKRNEKYSEVINWIITRLNFCILVRLQGTHVPLNHGRSLEMDNFELAYAQARFSFV